MKTTKPKKYVVADKLETLAKRFIHAHPTLGVMDFAKSVKLFTQCDNKCIVPKVCILI